MEDVRTLNILQVDIKVRSSHCEQFYMFSDNRKKQSVPRGLDYKVYHIKIWKECQKCPLLPNAPKCECPLLNQSVVLYRVYHGNGAIFKIDQHEAFSLELYEASTPVPSNMIRPETTNAIRNMKGIYRQAGIKMDGYQLSYFVSWLKSSPLYVEQVTNNLVCKIFKSTSIKLIYWGLVKVYSNQIKINLVEPGAHPLNMTWARMAIKTVNERREIQSAMAVLSTYGGALSALGEGQQKCAVAAGYISVEQFRLAYMLGDKTLMAQCRLYFAMSLIQRGKLSLGRQIIFEQYMNQKNLREPDVKTLNICRGIWARLKHEHARRRALRPKQFPRIVCPPPTLGGLRPILGRWRLMMM